MFPIRAGFVRIQPLLSHSQILAAYTLKEDRLVSFPLESRQSRLIRVGFAQFCIFALYRIDLKSST
jgi:hypothetical protein